MLALLVVILFANAGITKWVNVSMNEGVEESWQDVVNADLMHNQ